MGNGLRILIPWATLTNYPTGLGNTWDGQLVKNVPAYSDFTPSEAFAPTAPEMNYIFWVRDEGVLALTQWTGALDGQNFGALVARSAIGGTFGSQVSWALAVGAWVAFAGTGSAAQPYYSTDGSVWSTLGGTLNATPFGFASLPSGTLVAAASGAGVSGAVGTQVYLPASNTWAAENVGPAGFQTALNTNLIRAFAGGLVWAQSENTLGGASTLIAFSANAGTTWTVSGSGLPAGFGAANPLLPAVGASLMLLFTRATAATQYVSSPDGLAWTTQALPALLAGEAIVGASFDAVNALFYLAATSGTQCRVWQSATGLGGSWTLVATLSHPAASPAGNNGDGVFAANGGELAIVVEVGPAWRVLLSTSAAPGTWGFARSPQLAANASLKSEGAGFVYTDANNYSITLQAGTPPPLLT